MSDLPDLDFSDPQERAKMLLGAAGVLGGGLLGYFAMVSLKAGDLFMTEPARSDETTAFKGIGNMLAASLGLVLFGVAARETLKEYGTRTVLISAAAVSGGVGLITLLRR